MGLPLLAWHRAIGPFPRLPHSLLYLLLPIVSDLTYASQPACRPVLCPKYRPVCRQLSCPTLLLGGKPGCRQVLWLLNRPVARLLCRPASLLAFQPLFCPVRCLKAKCIDLCPGLSIPKGVANCLSLYFFLRFGKRVDQCLGFLIAQSQTKCLSLHLN